MDNEISCTQKKRMKLKDKLISRCAVNNGQILFLATIFSISLQSCAYFNTFYNTKKYYREAMEEKKKRTNNKPTPQDRSKFDKTIKQASKVLQLYPESKYVDDSLFLLGKSFFYLQQYRKAERKFHELVELFPEGEFLEDARIWLAKCKVLLGDYDVAADALENMARNSRKKAIRDEALFWLGETKWLQNDFANAVAAFERAVVSVEDKELKTRVNLRLGDSHVQLKAYKKAADSFEQATILAKTFEQKIDAYLEYGKVLNLDGRHKDAIAILSAIVESNVISKKKELSLARLEIAQAYMKLGDEETGLELYNEVIDDYPRTAGAAGAYLALAKYDEEIYQNYDGAEKSYANVKRQDAKSSFAREADSLGKRLQKLIKLNKGIADLEKKIQYAESVDTTRIVAGAQIISDIGKDASNDAGGKTAKEAARKTSRKTMLPANKSSQELQNAKKRISQKALQRQKSKKKMIVSGPGAIDSLNALLAIKNYEKAELFLFDFGAPDSAQARYYHILQATKDEKLRAKSFFALAYINDRYYNRLAARDSIYQVLANNYQDTPQGKHAARSLKLAVVKDDSEARIKARFVEIETNIFNREENAAIRSLEAMLADSTNEEKQQRVLYTLGWIYENKVDSGAVAHGYYQKLVTQFPRSEFAKAVKKKVDYIKKLEAEERKKRAAEARAKENVAAKTTASDSTKAKLIEARKRERLPLD